MKIRVHKIKHINLFSGRILENEKADCHCYRSKRRFRKEFARLLAARSEIVEIWAIAHNAEKLEETAKELGEKLRIFSLDLSDRESACLLAAELKKSDATVRYLVNNAGFAKFCSYDDISIEESLNMIDLNVGAVVALSLTCIPYMEKGSRILNIASQAAFFPLPYQNLYSSTKAFVRNYTRALNVELKEKGIGATAVCPGWMKTGLFDRGVIGAEKGTRNFSGMVTPDVVAKKALADADREKDMSIYGTYVKFTYLLSKIMPHTFDSKVPHLHKKSFLSAPIGRCRQEGFFSLCKQAWRHRETAKPVLAGYFILPCTCDNAFSSAVRRGASSTKAMIRLDTPWIRLNGISCAM